MDYTNKLGAATLSQGPTPTGRDKLFDALYNALGGTPDRRWAADKLTSALDWGTLGMLTGAYDGGRELAETGRPAALAMALMPGAKGVRAATEAAETAGRAGIRAFHGSPHDFDRFDLNKIGTGEGAQAYGHGLYFAENEGVARSYRDGLSKWQASLDGKSIVDLWSNGELPGALAAKTGLSRADASSAANIVSEAVRTGRPVRDVVADRIQRANDAYPPEIAEPEVARLSELSAKVDPLIESLNPGRMYEVNIKADPDSFLDWDKPLSQQSATVRGALGVGDPATADQASAVAGDLERVYAALASASGPQEEALIRQAHALEAQLATLDPKGVAQWKIDANANGPETSQRLRELGIPGIRYLDQGSRDAGEGSRNYVVFDDALIEILRKYGILPPALGGAALAAQSGDASAQGVMP